MTRRRKLKREANERRRSLKPIERTYARAIQRTTILPIVKLLRDRVLPKVRQLPDPANRADASDGVAGISRLDQDDDVKDILAELNAIRRVVAPLTKKAPPHAKRALRRVHDQQVKQLHQEVGLEVRAVGRKLAVRSRRSRDGKPPITDTMARSWSPERLGKRAVEEMRVDPFGSEPWLEGAMRQATKDNVALIKSIPARMLDEVEAIVTEKIRSGTRVETIAKLISDRFGIAMRRAELIAEDQAGKFYSALDERRMKRLGVAEYTWRTSRDERVRPEHRRREGKVFKWSDPPSDGHAGQAIRCRCFAEPRIPGLEDLL